MNISGTGLLQIGREHWQPGTERVQALDGILHSGYVVIATKHMHRLQICPIVHN